jgi:hypothetical protein
MLTATAMPRDLKLPVGSCDSSLTSKCFSPNDAASRGQAKDERGSKPLAHRDCPAAAIAQRWFCGPDPHSIDVFKLRA